MPSRSFGGGITDDTPAVASLVLVLGIESSCDETAAAVVEDHRHVRSSVVATQHDLHAEFGGVVPEIASRAHAERILPTIRAAVSRAGVDLADLDAVAVGHRPGLVGSLLIGLTAAKSLAWVLGKPLVGVDHVHAHLVAGELGDRTNALPPETMFPALGLVVSGGHTSLYLMRSHTELTRLGATIDDAVGEAYDKVAAMLGLGHPGGPAVDRLAQEPHADERAFEFPLSRLGKDALDFTFSGLKTAVLYEVKGRPQPRKILGKPEVRVEPAPEMTPQRARDVAASFQRVAVESVMIRLRRAIDQHPGVRSLVVGGGVSANSRLRAEVARFAHEQDLAVALPAMQYCIDNGAMIAALGSRRLTAGEQDTLDDLIATPTTAC